MTQPIKQRVEVENAASGELKEITRDADRLKQATEGQQRAADQATQVDRERSRALDGLHARLTELQRREVQLREAVQSGSITEAEAARVSRDRQRHIDRLSRSIAQQEDEQDRVNRSVRESVDRHREHNQVIDEGAQAADNAGQQQSGFNTVLAASARTLAGVAAGFAGANGLIALYDAYIERIERAAQLEAEQARRTRENAEARLNLAALRGVETPEDVARLDALASFAGRDPGEIARVQGSLQSQFPNASDEDISSLTLEVAAAAQLTDSSATDLARALSVIFRETGDARVAGNIFQESIQQAGEAEPGRLAQEIGRFIGIGGEIGGLDAGQAAGFASAGTGLGLTNEAATTGLKNVLFAIRGRGTPEGNELLDELGVSRDDVILALQQISAAVQSGQIDAAGLESIGGREAAPVFAALADPVKLQNFLTSVEAVDAAEDFEGRIVTDKAESIFTPGSIQAFNLLAKQAESGSDSALASSPEVAQREAARALFAREVDELVASGDVPPVIAERMKEEFAFQLASGTPIGEAADIAATVPRGDGVFRNPLTGDLQNRVPGVDVGGSLQGLQRNRAALSRRRRERGQDFDPTIATDILDALEEGPQTSPTTVIQNQTIISGTQINNATDPATGDRELSNTGRGR